MAFLKGGEKVIARYVNAIVTDRHRRARARPSAGNRTVIRDEKSEKRSSAAGATVIYILIDVHLFRRPREIYISARARGERDIICIPMTARR